MASEHSRADQLESGVRIGDFEIEKRLGAGGMGIVYQARQVSLNRRVALKVLGPALNQDLSIARFQREAQAVARLKHPAIATLYFIGQDSDLCYHVIELVDGMPLRRVLDRLAETHQTDAGLDTVVTAEETPSPDAPPVRFDQPTTPHATAPHAADTQPLSPAAKEVRRSQGYVRRCVEIVADVARALAYAHGEGVVHRDIKPENLMLDRAGKIHVIDFGLARFFDDVSITNTGQLVGTPMYMSPEQVTGRIKVDHRTDVYSLGLVLYELLTLKRPIEFTSRENLLRNIVTRALPPLCARNRSVPAALEAVVHKATHKDPEERYQTAEEMAADLQRFLDGKLVVAQPYHYRLDVRETVGNRPGTVVLSAFCCFLLGAGAFVILASIGTMSFFISDASGGQLVAIGQAFGGVVVGAVAIFLGLKLLAGWNWARWVMVVLAVGVGGACLWGIYLLGNQVLSTVRAARMMKEMEAKQKLQVDGKELTDLKNITDRKKAADVKKAGERKPSADPQKAEDAKKAEEPNKARAAPKRNTPVDTSTMMIGIMAMYAIPLLLILVMSVTTMVCLLLPGTAAWFRLASQARREHRDLLRALED